VSGIIANPAAAGVPESQNGLRIGGIRYLFIRKIIMHSTVISGGAVSVDCAFIRRVLSHVVANNGENRPGLAGRTSLLM
jgi:hypothetical protein